MEGTDICFAPVLTMKEASQHPHAKARDAYVDVSGFPQPAPAPRFSRTKESIKGPAAKRGQHTDEVLSQRGFSAKEIGELKAARGGGAAVSDRSTRLAVHLPVLRGGGGGPEGEGHSRAIEEFQIMAFPQTSPRELPPPPPPCDGEDRKAAMIRAFELAVQQLGDPKLRVFIWWSLLLSLVLQVGIGVLAWWGLKSFANFEWKWINDVIVWASGAGVVVLALMLFPASFGIVISIFMEYIADVVEARHYPQLGKARGIPVWTGIWTKAWCSWWPWWR